MVNYAGMLIVIMAMMVMLYIGTMDDILSLSPALRFAVEFFVALLLISTGVIFWTISTVCGASGIARLDGPFL